MNTASRHNFGKLCKLRTRIVILALAATQFSSPSAAMAQTSATPQTPGLASLTACRAIGSDTDRLACYDRATQALDAAEQAGDLVVVERGQIREARRQLFGFNSPDLSSILGKGREDDVEAEAVETTLTTASQNSEGKWTFHLADGAEWRQIDSAPVRFRNQPGAEVRVRRATLGSYLLTIGRSRAVRVKRQ